MPSPLDPPTPAPAVDGPPRWQVPPLRVEDGWLGGVSAALATEVGVPPIVIRLAFTLLALQDGLGAVIYGLAWFWLGTRSSVNLYQPQPKARDERFRYFAVGLIVVGFVIGGRAIGLGGGNPITIPIGLIAAGVMVAWSRRLGESGTGSSLRVISGVAIATVGLISAVPIYTSFVSWTLWVPIVLVNLVFLALVVPSVAGIGRDLDSERAERVRADERARVAAHLHDSVLQTLTLIQKSSDDPTRMASLARRQERELRSWLYGTNPSNPAATRMETALAQVATLVEQHHRIRVNLVVVGDDRDLEPSKISALVAAAREAVTNAAKHAKVDSVDVYAEVGTEGIEVFVRDDGLGFDPTTVPADRRGVADSIIGRVERAGGRAQIHSEPGEGTEVELFLPLPSQSGLGEVGDDGEEPEA